jgi:hypothetical protein
MESEASCALVYADDADRDADRAEGSPGSSLPAPTLPSPARDRLRPPC